jgi:hypothetical protein
MLLVNILFVARHDGQHTDHAVVMHLYAPVSVVDSILYFCFSEGN